MRAVDVQKTHVKTCVENALAARTYARFLEREVYAFLSTLDKRGERVRGDSCGPAFLFVGGPRKQAGKRRRTGRGATRRRPWARAAQGKGEVMFFFSWRKVRRALFFSAIEAENHKCCGSGCVLAIVIS